MSKVEPPINGKMPKYKETCIKDVNDFLLWVKGNYDVSLSSDNGQTFSIRPGKWYYRGQSCSIWDLKPSVFRNIPPYNSTLEEHSLLVKADLVLRNYVSSMSYVEKMIFFQHYGLSTRLLDVTFNPLVALYMACSDENHISCDGAVYCGCYVDAHDIVSANVMAKYVFEHEYQRVAVDIPDFANKERVNIEAFQQPIFILPPMLNPRVEAQDGAFIMAPLLEDVKSKNTFVMNRNGLECTNFFLNTKAIIKSCAKENILHKLSILGIDCSSIFPGIDSKLKSIMMEAIYQSHLYNGIEK